MTAAHKFPTVAVSFNLTTSVPACNGTEMGGSVTDVWRGNNAIC